jgi:hypothetical protein
MRLLVSFILSLMSVGVILFFFSTLFKAPKKEKEVFIHTAIVIKSPKKSLKPNKAVKKTLKKAIKPKLGSNKNITKGVEKIEFNDIFSNVSYNIKTKKIHLKESLDISRLKEIEGNLKKVKTLRIEYTQNGNRKLKKEDIQNIIAKKLYPIWDEIAMIEGEYAKINIISQDSNVEVMILDSNLPIDKQNELINRIKQQKFKDNFNITVLFQTKVENE